MLQKQKKNRQKKKMCRENSMQKTEDHAVCVCVCVRVSRIYEKKTEGEGND